MPTPKDRAYLLNRWDSLVAESPNAPALISADGIARSRRQLDQDARDLEDRLRETGLRPGEIAVIAAPNGPLWMSAFIAIGRLGGVCAPLDPDTSAARAEEVAAKLKAAALLTDAACERVDSSPRRFRDREIAVGKVTSGSAGAPKVFFMRASEMIADGERIADAMGIRSDDRNLGLTPFGHSYGLGNIVMPLLLRGAATSWGHTPFPHELARSISATQATILPTVPTVLRALCHSDVERGLLGSLRFALSAGARLEPELAQRFLDAFGLAPRNLYGSSETGGLCYDHTGECSLSGRSVGKPLPGVAIRSAPGQRLVAQSDAVYTYGNRRTRAGECLLADRGRILPSGEVQVLGRVGKIAKIGGKRISLAEIEARLRQVEGVSDSFARELLINGEPAIAAVAQSKHDPREIQTRARAALPRGLRPKRLLVLPRFPVTARGKTDARALIEAVAGYSDNDSDSSTSNSSS